MFLDVIRLRISGYNVVSYLMVLYAVEFLMLNLVLERVGSTTCRLRSVEFMINGSRIELRCRKCNSMVGWWHIFTDKIMPVKRARSEEESELALILIYLTE